MIRRDSPFVSFRRAGLNPDHSSPGQHRQAGRVLALAVLALAVVGVAIAGVVAWLTASSSLINEFGLGQVDTSVEETFDGGTTKSDVKAKNDGSVPIYVRAQVNIYWQDANGNQLWEEPVEGTDYTIEWGDGLNTAWIQGSDGFYYWTQPLAAGAEAENLIDKLTWKTADTSNGRTLVCDVSIQGIQADPANAVNEAWGAAVDQDGTLTPAQQGQGGE